MPNLFGQFNLKSEILEAIEKIGFHTPTKVQEALIPDILKGRDVVGQSQTGSGKTHTFLIPLFNNLNVDEQHCQAVITTPSRELAEQILKMARELNDQLKNPFSIQAYFGGTDKQKQVQALSKKQPQIVIGTPGRLKDLIESQALDVHRAQVMVVDEADMTLDMGFLAEVDLIASRMPKDLQTLVFSATMPEKLRPFLKKYLDNPHFEDIPVSTVIADTIDNQLLNIKSKDKNNVIYKLLTMGTPYLALVFTNTKERAKELTAFLRENGLKVAEIHGDIQPRERRRVMKSIKNLDYQYVVATDLAARGIDIEGVSLVINDDIPNDLEFFVHRVGRTGRNNMAGTSITLYNPDDEEKIENLEALGISFNAKQIKNNEIVDVKDRKARQKRVATTKKLDPTMIGLVKKKKKKVKPGYKRQIKTAIKVKNQQDRRIAEREARKAAKLAKKKSNQQF